jgi:hypothetical protein
MQASLFEACSNEIKILLSAFIYSQACGRCWILNLPLKLCCEVVAVVWGAGFCVSVFWFLCSAVEGLAAVVTVS